MTHLTVDEIITFVSMEKLDTEGIELLKKVNEHIRECPECMRKVQAYQLVYDELETMCTGSKFKEYVYSHSELKNLEL